MKLSIRFYIDKSKSNKIGKSAIKCRLTYLKKRKEFSTGQFINSNHWNSKEQLVKPPEPDCDIINSQLSLIKTKINRAFLLLQVKEDPFTVTDVFKSFKDHVFIERINAKCLIYSVNFSFIKINFLYLRYIVASNEI